MIKFSEEDWALMSIDSEEDWPIIKDDYEPLNEEDWGFIHGDGIGSEFTGA